MTRLLQTVDRILHGPIVADSGEPRLSASVGRLAACTFLFGAFYGCAMGSFGGIDDGRGWQILVSGVKVPLFLLGAFALSLPSFFVLNSLLGVRADFGTALLALTRSQAGLAVVLAALAPYTLFWYASSANYPWALMVNGLMFALASLAGQFLLRVFYRPLIARQPVQRWLLRIWLVVYVFVAIQLAWFLRPFVGQPDAPVQFFRSEALSNAYIAVGRLVCEALKR